MTTNILASAPGTQPPRVEKAAGQSAVVLIDFAARLASHELLVCVADIDADGAVIESRRCNQCRYVQLVLGAETVAPGRPHADHTLKLRVTTNLGEQQATFMLRSLA